MALFSACGGSALPFFLGLGCATCSCSFCTGLVLVTCGDSLSSPLSAAPAGAPRDRKSYATRNSLNGSYIGSSAAFDGGSSFGGSDLVFSAEQPWTADQYAAYLTRAAPSTSRMSRLASDQHHSHSLRYDEANTLTRHTRQVTPLSILHTC
ncbi:unnamed protein product [Closterium sp. Naga37s-1]|nr:unnamed protein product [Closterium sp. Naga37s-1]